MKPGCEQRVPKRRPTANDPPPASSPSCPVDGSTNSAPKYTCLPPVSLSPIPLSLSLSETTSLLLHHRRRPKHPLRSPASCLSSTSLPFEAAFVNPFGPSPLHLQRAPQKASSVKHQASLPLGQASLDSEQKVRTRSRSLARSIVARTHPPPPPSPPLHPQPLPAPPSIIS